MKRVVPLKVFCDENKAFSYHHFRALDREGIRCGVVHFGRKLYLDLDVFEAFCARGGSALPGGWKREPAPDDDEAGPRTSETRRGAES